jgi:hypothetical protein
MNFEDFENADSGKLRASAKKCFALAALEPEGTSTRTELLAEAKMYLEQVAKKHETRIGHRDFWLELIVIFLIGWEIYEGYQQANVLSDLQKAMASTSSTVVETQKTTEMLNQAAQRQAGALSDVSVGVYFFDGVLSIVNNGKQNAEITFYQLDGRYGERFAKPFHLASGASYRVPDSWLAELLALRSLFLNLEFRAAGQAPVTEADMRGLIERADATKMQRARERLEAVRAESRKAAAETQPEES